MNNLLIAGILYTIIMAFIVWKYKIRSIEIIIFMILFNPVFSVTDSTLMLQAVLIIFFSTICALFKIFTKPKEISFGAGKNIPEVLAGIINVLLITLTYRGLYISFSFILEYLHAFYSDASKGSSAQAVMILIVSAPLAAFLSYITYLNKILKYIAIIFIIIGLTNLVQNRNDIFFWTIFISIIILIFSFGMTIYKLNKNPDRFSGISKDIKSKKLRLATNFALFFVAWIGTLGIISTIMDYLNSNRIVSSESQYGSMINISISLISPLITYLLYFYTNKRIQRILILIGIIFGIIFLVSYVKL